jgi:VanZ family protein
MKGFTNVYVRVSLQPLATQSGWRHWLALRLRVLASRIDGVSTVVLPGESAGSVMAISNYIGAMLAHRLAAATAEKEEAVRQNHIN